MGKRLTYYILIGLLLGAVLGLGINAYLDDNGGAGSKQATEIAGYFSIITALFLRFFNDTATTEIYT